MAGPQQPPGGYSPGQTSDHGPQPPRAPYPPPGQYPPPATAPTPYRDSGLPPGRRKNGAGATALVVGVLGLVLAVLIVFAPLGAVLGVIAVVFGIVGIVRIGSGSADNRGQAIAGLVTGALGVVIGVAITVAIGSFLARHADDLADFGRCLDNATTEEGRDACATDFANRVGG